MAAPNDSLGNRMKAYERVTRTVLPPRTHTIVRAVRNSIAMAARAHFPHRRLQGVHTGGMQELLRSEAGVNGTGYPAGVKRGRVVTMAH